MPAVDAAPPAQRTTFVIDLGGGSLKVGLAGRPETCREVCVQIQNRARIESVGTKLSPLVLLESRCLPSSSKPKESGVSL